MPRLLLVEDEIGALASLKRSLARAGFEVLVATNLPDALSAVEHDRVDAILVAAGLQGESATSLVEAIRGVDLLHPVVVMGEGSATGEPSLPKPVDAGRLIELLRELLPGTAPKREGEEPEGEPQPAALWRTEDHASADVVRQAQAAEARGVAPNNDLARRRELAAKALAEAQARRRAAEAARPAAESAPEPAAVPRPVTIAAPAAAPKPAAVAPAVPARVAPSPSPEPSPAEPPADEIRGNLPLGGPLGSPPVGEIRSPPSRASLADQVGESAGRPEEGLAERSEEIDRSRREPSRQPSPRVVQPAKSLGVELFGDLPRDSVDPEPVARAPLVVPPAHVHRAENKGEARPPEAKLAETKLEPRGEPPPPKPQFPPEGLEIPVQGSLEKFEPAALLIACYRARLTGQLRLDQGPVQRVLYFGDGRLAGAASTSAEERLEALSYRRGLITREQQRQLRADDQTPTRRLALLMVERSFLKPAELFPLVQERVEEIIYEACGSFAGSYELLADQVPDDERVALSRSPVALATEGIRRKYLMDRLLADLGGPATLLRPSRVRGPELSEFGLTARERRLAQAVDGLRNIEELLFESGIEPLPGLKILCALLLGRAVEIAVRGLAVDASPEAEARIDLSRVSEKYAQVRSGNYFEVLGVSLSATGYEIGQAYDRLSREFQPTRFRSLRRAELPAQLDEIQRVLAEARDILVDEGLREEYRAHLR